MKKPNTRKASPARAARATRSVRLCKNGLHPMTASNRYVHPNKGTMCRTCIRDYMREYMRTRRAELEARKKPKSRSRKA
jgi:hypothetical protein